MSANSYLDCAALLFSPNYKFTNWLISEIKAELMQDLTLTDMSVLYKVRTKFPDKILLFPSTTVSIADKELIANHSRFDSLTHLSSYFDGIFDTLSIGMWLTGQNPRNTGGRIVRYEHFFVQDNRFDQNSFLHRGERVYIDGERQIELFSVHVHSKNLRLFKDTTLGELSNLISESRNSSKKYDFSFRAWLGAIFDIHMSTNKRSIYTIKAIIKGKILSNFARAILVKMQGFFVPK